MQLEHVGKFCMGDILNEGRGAKLAFEAGVSCARRNYKDLSGILTRKEVPLKLKGRMYVTCVRSAMVYGSETWAVNA